MSEPELLRLRSMTIGSETVIDLSSTDLVVLVGPNNCGKTTALREVISALASPEVPRRVVTHVDYENDFGAGGEVLWARLLEVGRPSPVRPDAVLVEGLGLVSRDDFGASPPLSRFVNVLTSFLDASGRLNGPFAGPRPQRHGHDQLPIPSMMSLRKELADELSDLLLEAFGVRLYVDAHSDQINLRIAAELPSLSDEDFLPSGLPGEGYFEKVEALDPIAAAGDGLRSLASIFIRLAGARSPLVLIDEPEAFLHPPQQRTVGRLIADRTRERQIFVATHSTDVLRGLLGGTRRPTVVRLARDGNEVSGTIVGPDELREWLSDPLLSRGRVLDGVFHEGVIVCEGDTDAVFYESVFNAAVAPARRQSGQRVSDLLFINGSTASRIPAITRILRKLNVPCRVVIDFDVLGNPNLLKEVVAAMGGDWDSVKADVAAVDRGVRDHATAKKVADLRVTINEVFETETASYVTDQLRSRLKGALQGTGYWARAKEIGIAAVGHGEARAAAERLIASLGELGVHVVKSGAVESFVPAVGGSSGQWLASVLERGAHTEVTSEASMFVSGVVGGLCTAT